MELSVLLDTNIILYYVGGLIELDFNGGPHFVSVITEIELLSYPRISAEEEATIRNVLRDEVSVLPLTKSVAETAIKIRRAHRLKLPDAIILATSVEGELTLLTNDQKLISLDVASTQTIKLKT